MKIWMKSMFIIAIETALFCNPNNYVMKYCHRWLKFGRENCWWLSDNRCNNVNLWCQENCLLQNDIDFDIRFTISVGDVYTDGLQLVWSKTSRTVTLNTVLSVVLWEPTNCPLGNKLYIDELGTPFETGNLINGHTSSGTKNLHIGLQGPTDRGPCKEPSDPMPRS